MFKKLKIKKSLIAGFLGVALFSLIGFVEKKHSAKSITHIVVNIDFEFDNYFIDEQTVVDLMTYNGSQALVGEKYENVNLKDLEKRIQAHKFVKNAQVYKDHKGNLIVEVKQCRPVARVIQPYGPHAYISSEGHTLSTSEQFTSRVLLIDGDGALKLMSAQYLASEEGKPYLDLINIIDGDRFWKAQIAQLTINKSDIRI